MKRTPILLTAGALAALMTAGLLTSCGGSGKNGSSGDDNKLYVYTGANILTKASSTTLKRKPVFRWSTTYLKPTKKCIL